MDYIQNKSESRRKVGRLRLRCMYDEEKDLQELRSNASKREEWATVTKVTKFPTGL
jgi:hypothetical protein